MDNKTIYGLHAVEASLKQNPSAILCIAVLENRHDKKIQELIQLAKNHRVKINFLSRHELDEMSDQQNHQGIIAICSHTKKYTEDDIDILLEKSVKPFLLILDCIQDPHNLGACLRSAEAAGVDVVIAPKDKSAAITPTVSKVASGAAEKIPFIQVTNLARTLTQLKEKNIWIVGAASETDKTLYEIDLTGAIAIVVGAEGEGLRRLTKEHCDFLAKIPMPGTTPSLNVSVAAGIFLFETVRQRLIL
jgi:23S rRNA (guanosine2251-2'-O)-methyltransferase